MVRHARSSMQMESLERGDLDLAVVFEWERMPQGELLMLDPTVWATSDVHRMHKQSPLPIAPYYSPGWCSTFPLSSLSIHGQDYRVPYLSDPSAGLKLAASRGLSLT